MPQCKCSAWAEAVAEGCFVGDIRSGTSEDGNSFWSFHTYDRILGILYCPFCGTELK